MTEDLDITTSQYNLLYTAFSFPNIFLTLIGGLIIDFLGKNLKYIKVFDLAFYYLVH